MLLVVRVYLADLKEHLQAFLKVLVRSCLWLGFAINYARLPIRWCASAVLLFYVFTAHAEPGGGESIADEEGGGEKGSNYHSHVV